jgi:hypothetical protein
MSDLLDLQEKLRDTSAAIAQYERAVAKGSSPSVISGLRSLKNRLSTLEAEFLNIAKRVGVDVCSYRLFSDDVLRPAAAGVFSVIGDFQELFSTVYSAIKDGPKKRAAITPDVAEASAFRFGYSFSGSVGIVLTLDNEQLLFTSTLDEAMDKVLELAQSRHPEQVLIASRTLGQPAIKAMQHWASDHIKIGMGADIEWRRGQEVRSRLLIQLPELKVLSAVLEEAAEPIEVIVVLPGKLVGTETETSRRFHFQTDAGEDLRGAYSADAISDSRPVTMPARYMATFRKTFKKIVATDEEQNANYYLLKLDPL